MAGKSTSAEKRHRQSEERRIRNKAAKSAVKTSVRKLETLVRGKNPDGAETALKDMIKKLDTAAGKGIIKKNAAARKKSRMQRLFNTLKKAE
ncbi:MAG: 30S ribosomal protein S20 [Spirochaetaceae bacterium]|nr:30S ribosomal protein S20 [Spirochaetaceae bacterium]